MKGYELKVSALAAALMCAGKKDVRYYLNGVLLDFRAGKIVATDGHRLFCGAIPAVDFPPVIVPRDIIESTLKAHKALPKRARQGMSLYVNVRTVSVPKAGHEPAHDVTHVELQHVAAGARFEAPAIDGRFPEYARVITTETSGTPSGYNAQYIAEAAEALATYREADTAAAGSFMKWHFNGPHGAGTFTQGDAPALVVIMPVRESVPDYFEPLPEGADAEAIKERKIAEDIARADRRERFAWYTATPKPAPLPLPGFAPDTVPAGDADPLS